MNQIQQTEISRLIPYEFNNKVHSEEQTTKIANSIQECGFRAPILVDEKMVILAGHGRLLAAKKLGLKEVPVIQYTDLTEIQKKKYRILDNRLSDLAEYDMSNLELELEDIGDDDLWDMFDDFDFDCNLELDDIQDEDELPISSKEPLVQLGDIYLLGDHVLVVGDSTDPSVYGDIQADLMLTDPPYNVDYEGSAGKIQNDNQEESVFRSFLHDAFSNMYGHTKDGGPIYVFHSDTEWESFRHSFKNAGYKLSQCLIRAKDKFVMGRQDYHRKHEPILYGWKEGTAHTWNSDRTQTTILEYDKPQISEEHPTMKPIELLTYLIQNSSKQKSLILDPFGGSGSTLIACEYTKRRCYTIEIDPKYAEVIIRRYAKLFPGREVACANREMMIQKILDNL